MMHRPCRKRDYSHLQLFRWIITLQIFCLSFVSCFLAPAHPASFLSPAVQTRSAASARTISTCKFQRLFPACSPSPWTAKCQERGANVWQWRLPGWPGRKNAGQAARQVSVQDTTVCGGEEELLNRLLDCSAIEFDVREAEGMEGDLVAQLRCSAFDQGEDMYHSQRRKMRKSPNYLLAGVYHTTFLVAVARGTTQEGSELCKRLRYRELDQLLADDWINTREFFRMKKQVEDEWAGRPELVVGSVDCSVHESFDSNSRLVRWIYISSMAVQKEFRRRGLGALLLGGANKLAHETYDISSVFLHVEEENAGALRLYKRAGFERADMAEKGTNSMDRMLRLVLQVPRAAALYQRHLRKPKEGEEKKRSKASSEDARAAREGGGEEGAEGVRARRGPRKIAGEGRGGRSLGTVRGGRVPLEPLQVKGVRGGRGGRGTEAVAVGG